MAWGLQDMPGLSLLHKHFYHKVVKHVVSNMYGFCCSIHYYFLNL